MITKRGFFAILAVLILASVVVAQSISTHVVFIVPSTVAFRVTLPGTAGFNSSTGQNITLDIAFNVSREFADLNLTDGAVTAVGINATVRHQPTNAQSADSGIFNYTNIGNQILNVSLKTDVVLPIWPTNNFTLTLYAANASTEFDQPCTAVGGQITGTTCVYINSTAVSWVAKNISTGATTSVWVWADFYNVSAGTIERNISHVANQQ